MTWQSQGGRLVIGIGNPLRGDDGVGALLAEQAALFTAADPDGPVAVRSVQQLTPELAEELARLEAVLFIDAWLAPTDAAPRLEALPPGPGEPESGVGGHHLDPAQLLAITAVLHGRAPQGWWLRVPARAVDHGTQLSPALQATLPTARALLRGWLSGDA